MTRQLSLLEQHRLQHPAATDADHVVRWAADLVEELELEPPVDLDLVASYLGIADIEAGELDVAGCLLCHRQRVIIKVRREDPAPRRRFTVCHECTHTFFPGFARRPQYRCNPGQRPHGDVRLERLCDVGASELLLPRKRVVKDLRAQGFGLATLEDISERYQASLEATGHRLVGVSTEPSLFLILEVATKPSERGDIGAIPKLRIRAHRAQGPWPFPPQHKSVPEGTPLHRALEGQLVHETGDLVGLTREPVTNVQIDAGLYPYGPPGRRRRRVLALVRPASTRSPRR